MTGGRRFYATTSNRGDEPLSEVLASGKIAVAGSPGATRTGQKAEAMASRHLHWPLDNPSRATALIASQILLGQVTLIAKARLRPTIG